MCNKEIFDKISKEKLHKKKNNLTDNFMNIIIDDLKYSNNLILKNLILENKIFFSFFNKEKKISHLKFCGKNLEIKKNIFETQYI